jgi:hypothetical protein
VSLPTCAPRAGHPEILPPPPRRPARDRRGGGVMAQNPDRQKWNMFAAGMAIVIVFVGQMYFQKYAVKSGVDKIKLDCINGAKEINDKPPFNTQEFCSCLIDNVLNGDPKEKARDHCVEKYLKPATIQSCEDDNKSKNKNIDCECYYKRLLAIAPMSSKSFTAEKQKEFDDEVSRDCKLDKKIK